MAGLLGGMYIHTSRFARRVTHFSRPGSSRPMHVDVRAQGTYACGSGSDRITEPRSRLSAARRSGDCAVCDLGLRLLDWGSTPKYQATNKRARPQDDEVDCQTTDVELAVNAQMTSALILSAYRQR